MSRTYIILSAVVTILIVGFAFAYFAIQPTPQSHLPVNDQLRAENTAFAEADALMKSNQYPVALQKYQEALQSAKTPAEKGQIEYRIGTARVLAGDNAGGIDMLKSVAANASYMPITRAYAVQYLGQLFYSSTDTTVYDRIFNSAPFASLVVQDNKPKTLRFLFEYGTALYPLAISELRIAQWYAIGLSLSTVKADVEKTASYRSKIDAALFAADADIARARTVPDEAALVPTALMHKGILLGLLVEAGEPRQVDTRQAFEDSIATYSVIKANPGSDSFTRLNYARYLALSEGKDTAAKIHELVVPLYEDPAYEGSGAVSFLKGYASIASTFGVKQSIKDIAALDSGFKQFLLSNGWEEADLK